MAKFVKNLPVNGNTRQKSNGNAPHDMTRKTARRATQRIYGTLTILLPTYYNREADGTRKRVEVEKFRRTMHEIHGLFNGFMSWPIKGWYRDPKTGKGINDRLMLFHINGVFDSNMRRIVRSWCRVLETRFQQHSIYSKFERRISGGQEDVAR